MRVLMDWEPGCHGLTQEEAERVWAKYGSDTMPELGAGPCRLCGGTGKVEHFRIDAFGYECSVKDQCFTCNGSGTDPRRIKVLMYLRGVRGKVVKVVEFT